MASISQLPAGFENSNSLLSVLEITKQPLTSVPECYVRTVEREPASSLFDGHKGTFPSIPSIDMTKLVKAEASDFADQLEKLHSTCKDWGIFEVCIRNISNFLDPGIHFNSYIFRIYNIFIYLINGSRVGVKYI